MKLLHIITPVKDSLDSTLETARAIMGSDLQVPHTYTIYNDFSTPENTERLKQAAEEMGFRLVNLSDLTCHPSPNYLLILQREREACLQDEAGLLIVESDVEETIKNMGYIGKIGMKQTDKEILNVMIDKVDVDACL